MTFEQESKTKAVYTIVERHNAKSLWIRIGIGFVNRDGSINLRLDAVPVNGRLHVRDFKFREDESVQGKPDDASVSDPQSEMLPHGAEAHNNADRR